MTSNGELMRARHSRLSSSTAKQISLAALSKLSLMTHPIVLQLLLPLRRAYESKTVIFDLIVFWLTLPSFCVIQFDPSVAPSTD